jgi:hypothetical protein
METYLDGTGYTYGTANQYPEVGYWILRRDTKLWILVSHLDTEKKINFSPCFTTEIGSYLPPLFGWHIIIIQSIYFPSPLRLQKSVL